MTCFWDGIIQALDLSDYRHVGCYKNLNRIQLINFDFESLEPVKCPWLIVQGAEDEVVDYDMVIDGTDNFPTRYLVNDACVILNKPNVTS